MSKEQESLAQASERFRELLRSCPHHGFNLSYPNFVRGPLLDDMRPFFGPCEVLGTHH